MPHLNQHTRSKPAFTEKFVFGENRENSDHSEMVSRALRVKESNNAASMDDQLALDAVDVIGQDFTRSQMAGLLSSPKRR